MLSYSFSDHKEMDFPVIDQLNIPHCSFGQYVHNNLMFLEDGHIVFLKNKWTGAVKGLLLFVYVRKKEFKKQFFAI